MDLLFTNNNFNVVSNLSKIISHVHQPPMNHFWTTWAANKAISNAPESSAKKQHSVCVKPELQNKSNNKRWLYWYSPGEFFLQFWSGPLSDKMIRLDKGSTIGNLPFRWTEPIHYEIAIHLDIERVLATVFTSSTPVKDVSLDLMLRIFVPFTRAVNGYPMNDSIHEKWKFDMKPILKLERSLSHIVLISHQWLKELALRRSRHFESDVSLELQLCLAEDVTH